MHFIPHCLHTLKVLLISIASVLFKIFSVIADYSDTAQFTPPWGGGQEGVVHGQVPRDFSWLATALDT